MLHGVFSSLLPAALIERTSKAAFGAVFFGPASRSLAEVAVDELGDLEPVDTVSLRALWSEEVPDAHSFLLLQAALVRNLDFGTVASQQGAT